MPVEQLRPKTPPRPNTPSGWMRRVGVEIEYANVAEPASAALVERNFGGRIRRGGPHRLHVDDTVWGDFTVELDTQYAHVSADGDKTGYELLNEMARDLIGDAVAGIVPYEIVCPPIPWENIAELNPLFDGLRDLGAEGTQESALYGFGLHLNVEIADDSVDDLVQQLRAYLLMSDWLRREIAVDFTRLILPHASRFPEDYLLLVMAPDYRPDMEQFIENYAAFNPTRNRELDLYPLFKHLMPDLIDELVDDPRIKARPTFHYRLPNASLTRPGWYAVTEWNRWVEVERLAANRDRLDAMAGAFFEHREFPFRESWLDRLGRFLSE